MLDEEKVQYAVQEFCKNPYWKEEYDSAPTPRSKRFEELIFYASEFPEADDFQEERYRLEEEMGLEDWEYLYRTSGNDPWGARCRRKVKELKARQEASQSQEDKP
ncbi:MAG: hypothetical protein LUE27_06470 [Clostridia bacterium]|nr:hypothetical protein [Clostridia bacterium]